MDTRHALPALAVLLCGSLPSAMASAQQPDPAEGPPRDDDRTTAQSDADPTPRVPKPGDTSTVSSPDVVEQAGVGGPVAFGEAYVLEIGGSASILAANDFIYVRLSPFLGWFPIDNVELTFMNDVFIINRKEGGLDVGFVGAIEPSVHYPLTDRWLLFLGVGGGVIHNGEDTGGLVRPRFGTDVLVGRSGILRPAVSLTWTSINQLDVGGTIIQDDLTFGFELGYAVMF